MTDTERIAWIINRAVAMAPEASIDRRLDVAELECDFLFGRPSEVEPRGILAVQPTKRERFEQSIRAAVARRLGFREASR